MPKKPLARPQTSRCFTVDSLEAYVLGRVHNVREVEAIEEHLLWCPSCQSQAEAEEIHSAVLCAALTAFSGGSDEPLKSMTAGR